MKIVFSIVLLLLISFIAGAADEVYVTILSNSPARLSNGDMFMLKRGACFRFVKYDSSSTFAQLQFGASRLWTRRANTSFVPKSETPAAIVKYTAETKLALRTGNAIDPGKRPPWIGDQVKTVAPDYPDSEKLRHHEGSGLFHLTLDRKTGSVTKVAVTKSTGYPLLDHSAIFALRQWQWIPGTWTEVDVPITFQVKRTGGYQIPSNAVRLPSSL
jgi:TonB family protein